MACVDDGVPGDKISNKVVSSSKERRSFSDVTRWTSLVFKDIAPQDVLVPSPKEGVVAVEKLKLTT